MFQSPGRATVATLKARANVLTDGAIVGAKRLANNTLRADLADGGHVVLLHNTAILRVAADGTIAIDTGGFNSHTTRDRLNAYLPNGWRVFTQGGTIHLWRYADTGRTTPVPFLQRCSITPAGDVRPDVSPAELLSDSKMVDRFMGHVKRVGLPSAEDSKGNPWIFLPGQLDAAVARDWLESLYWTRRLYTLALQKAGMPEEGITYSLHRLDRDGGKLDRLDLGRVRRLLRNAIGRG